MKDMIQPQKNLPCFNEYFCGIQYDDEFGHSSQWNKEVEKWLAFIKQKSNKFGDKFYDKQKSNVKIARVRDTLLGEYKAVYFVEKKQNGEILGFEPKGAGNHKLDFCFKDAEGKKWFAEVKSPSWRNEVAEEVESKCLRELRAKTVSYGLVKDDNKYKGEFSTSCSVCKTSIEFISEKLNDNGHIIDEEIKNIKCPKCRNTLWNLLEVERTKLIENRKKQPQHINGETRGFSIESAIKYGVKKSIDQFIPDRNNILIITPNMFSETVAPSKLFNGEMIREIVNNIDKQKVISRIYILEIKLPYGSELEYEYNCIKL